MGESTETPEGVASNVTVKVPVCTAGNAVFWQVVFEVRHCDVNGLTTNVTVVVCVKLPLVPVMASVGLPVGVELLVETVSVEVPEPLTEVGLNVAVASVGKPLALRATLPLKPFTAVTVAV